MRAPGERCAHNLNYWNFGDYLGIGAGAHGKLSDPAHGLVVRTQQTREPRRYLAADPRSLIRKQISQSLELPFEFAMNGFRLVEGFDDMLFEDRTGLSFDLLERALGPLVGARARGKAAERWRATPKGFRFLNDILVELLPAAAASHRALDATRPRLGAFMHRRPPGGHVNKGITAGFTPVAR